MFTKTIFATFIAAQVLFALLILTAAAARAQTSTAARFHEHRGQARYASEKWEQAIADYDRALAIEPRNAAVFNARGLAWLAMNNYGLAIRDFNQAIKLAPDFAAAYANRGLARMKQKQNAKAARDFAKCIELDERLRAHVEDLKRGADREVAIHR